MITKITTHYLAFLGVALWMSTMPITAMAAAKALPTTNLKPAWLSIQHGLNKKPLHYSVKHLTARHFNFTAISSGLNITPIKKEGFIYHQFVPPGGQILGKVGKPGLPGFSRLVAVPKGAQIQVEINTGKPLVLDGYTVYPVQTSPEDSIESRQRPFSVNRSFYKTGVTYPEKLFSIEYDWIRGCKVAIIHVHMARYNPLQKRLWYYPDIEVDIQFKGGEDTFIPKNKRTRFFEQTYAKILSNYEITKVDASTMIDWHKFFCDLLIITPADFMSQSDALADWKTRKGFRTQVATLDAIEESQGGTTAEDIRDYIHDYYETRNLSYVLLMGDAEHIPPHYVTPHPTRHFGTLMGTDLYYAEMDYAGYYPDLAVGRIPINTVAEAQTVVDKIIQYEQYPPWSFGFYDSILFASYFQDGGNDGRADRAFAETIEELRDYFAAEGYGHLPREYTTNSSDPRWYDDGSPIPAALRMPGFPWDGSAEGIIDEIDSGTFLVLHRDHGGRSGWGDPDFRTHDLMDLDNGTLLPVCLSINCQTGWFDNETDDAILGTGSGSESFAEEFLKMEGGSVAVIAATRNTPSYPNNDLIKAFVDGIWNDMLPGFPPAGSDAAEFEGSGRLGDSLNYAKFYVASRWTGVSNCQREFELYHVLGDPTMEIWTEYPHPRLVRLPFEAVIPHRWDYWFPLEMEGIIATLIQEGEILGQGISSKGGVAIRLNKPLSYSQNTLISLSKKGYVTQVLKLSVKQPAKVKLGKPQMKY